MNNNILHDNLKALSEQVLALCRDRGLRLVTAESCTGGLLAAHLSDIPGASDVLEYGFVTYSDAAKEDLLGVPADMLAQHGAVSEAVARAMADGARGRSGAGLALAITGIAGPGGGSPRKPVGLVHVAAAGPGGRMHGAHLFAGQDRRGVRQAAAAAALDAALEQLQP